MVHTRITMGDIITETTNNLPTFKKIKNYIFILKIKFWYNGTTSMPFDKHSKVVNIYLFLFIPRLVVLC